MEERLADQLGLEGSSANLCLKWTAGTVRVEEDSKMIAVEISGTSPSAKRYHVPDVRTVKELDLPVQSMNSDDMKRKYSHLKY